MRSLALRFSAILLGILLGAAPAMFAQSSSGSISGTVVDSTGAVIPGASIVLENSVSGLSRTTRSDAAGHFQITNLPYNTYRLTIALKGFSNLFQRIEVQSSVPVQLKPTLSVEAAGDTIDVQTTAMLETDSTFHTDLDRGAFDKLPLESQSSSLSSLVTLSSPGVTADSNGLFHGLGDHASNSFSIDGQPITDQQSKVFSNQLPANAVQSIEVIDGAPPAEFGGKTSLVIDVTTRSGLGTHQPSGSLTASYGSFGSASTAVDLAAGTDTFGNFIEVDALNTGRFLDPPEFAVFHDKGNEFNIFDRIDSQLTDIDAFHLNVSVSRSWFQTPNTFDNLNIQNVTANGTTASPTFGNVGNTDQRSKILTYDVAPAYSRTLTPNSVFNLGLYIRRDRYDYYPSNNALADLGDIQNETIAQDRSLTNLGGHTDLSYVHRHHNIKIGANYSQTFLRESDSLAIVNSTFNSPCTDTSGNPIPGFNSTTKCAAAGDLSNDPALGGSYNPILLPYDLTRGGKYFLYAGRTDVKELALYVQDQIKAGNWLFNLGIRGDLYNGLTRAQQAEPRLGLSYNIKKSATVLRASYARTLESPFNENLVLSSQGCGSPVLAPLLACSAGVSTTLQPGFKNEFHVGFQQAAGKYFVLSGEYIWKYTHNAFDFSVLGDTPITFPIDWHNSKIPGYALHADIPNFHHFSAFVVASSVAARFFPQQVAGAGATVGQSGYPFRIDHDEKFNQTTHLQYQLPGHLSPWVAFNWRYDSGLTAGATPCYGVTDPNSLCANTSILINGQPGVDLSYLTPDQQFQAGLVCNGFKATPSAGIPNNQCLASQLTSNLLSIPAPNTEDDDRNPPRIAPRSVFDISLGNDNLLANHLGFTDKRKLSLRITAVNVTNKYALYNFLSTFSGTHYVTPRAINAELGFHF